jgi:hypothetical protein
LLQGCGDVDVSVVEETIEPYKLTYPGMAGQKKWNGSCITDT